MKCPHPIELQEKLARLGWAGWYPTPGVTDEDKVLYASLGDNHIPVIAIEEALALPDEALQQRIESAMGMSFAESCERYGIDITERPDGVLYPHTEGEVQV
jgi:hypothetical protein